ncbi:hypothetical protein CONCODRAFT_74560 [Conidiobolus coronatus NRRL 28638]|uniref:Uncharacterized protein n=1 Tax=Conidiobolus coronatus (strain ATCC 28846 / CBS 209.66 / NRRL 28638) TaxID=796925 RepID=A0A137NQ75_CONC2|nr:hypothetical protein CONCODRAFT_74560 [Conidiobolus coronatus NRRL 28638]|eukprot:KXN64903.1 hypothetical protein CONCODRAFT_74560 [Conidiobolus coronatus NRRL 28638]
MSSPLNIFPSSPPLSISSDNIDILNTILDSNELELYNDFMNYEPYISWLNVPTYYYNGLFIKAIIDDNYYYIKLDQENIHNYINCDIIRYNELKYKSNNFNLYNRLIDYNILYEDYIIKIVDFIFDDVPIKFYFNDRYIPHIASFGTNTLNHYGVRIDNYGCAVFDFCIEGRGLRTYTYSISNGFQQYSIL